MQWGLAPIAYLLGTFPGAAIVARSGGIDITTAGSGNPGASNVARVMGTRWGVLVFVLDALKGAIPAAVGLVLDQPRITYVLVGAAVLGHMYPVTRRFQGGKGVATLGGAMIVLHLLVFTVLLAVWVVVRRTTGKASLGSLIIAVGLPVGVAVVGAPGWEVGAVAVLCVLVLLRHADNIRRLWGGRELSASQT